MRFSRIFQAEDLAAVEDTVPMRRILFWVVIWMVILGGIALFFKYARFLSPLLD